MLMLFRYESIIATLCENLDSLDEPDARGAMIWIVGEYAERIDNADELLESFLEGFHDESTQVSSLKTITKFLGTNGKQLAFIFFINGGGLKPISFLTFCITFQLSTVLTYCYMLCFALQVQLTLLTAIVKLFLKKPSETQELVQQVLSLATQVRVVTVP